MSKFSYDTTPPLHLFEEMKQLATLLRKWYDDTYWYASEKIDRVNRINNVWSNIRAIYGMFDYVNQTKVKNFASGELFDLIDQYDLYNLKQLND